MQNSIVAELKKELASSLDALKTRLSGVRTSRATPALLESLTVEAYGGRTPLSQVSTVSAPEARTLSIQVWDSSVVSAVSKALQAFGMNPVIDGNILKVHLPELTQERRKEFAKIAKDHAENTKIGVRNVRRETLDGVSKDDFSEDEWHNLKKEVQKIVDDTIAEIERLLAEKEKEILKH
ncbi:MAG: ribosome recycling factor [Alphaproteobacteria bacterium]|nr:ribosome recycling factor [Alphaproteobacteria bacterium]